MKILSDVEDDKPKTKKAKGSTGGQCSGNGTGGKKRGRKGGKKCGGKGSRTGKCVKKSKTGIMHCLVRH